MQRIILSIAILLAALNFGWSQGSVFGVKGGLTLGVQEWESFQQDPLFKYHGAVFIESLPEDNEFALLAQLGYHLKGSAIRNRLAFTFNGDVFSAPTQEFIFRNLSLVLGAKQKFDMGVSSKAYYLLGIRGDYTLSTNLSEYDRINMACPIYPADDDFAIRNFNYGITLGGGIEFEFAELIGAMIEFSVNPDFSLQYESPRVEINNSSLCRGSTSSITVIPERRIRNLTFELSAGFRFLRKVEYID